MHQSSVNAVDYGFLAHRSAKIVCSRCLKTGIRTPVVQIISARHRLLSLCRACRDTDHKRSGKRSA